MDCKTCGYALWNLPDRTCPECGTGFKPSDFDFRPGTARFICPHCRQDYYGTDARGHLVPNAFDCVSCHKHISMDEMVMLPAEGVDESKVMAFTNPWLDRPSGGMLRSWFKALGMSLFQPIALMRGTDPSSSLKAAWGFCIINFGVALAAIALALGSCVGIMVLSANQSQSGGIGTGGAGLTPIIMVYGVMFAGPIVAAFVLIPVWIVTAHAALRLTGPTEHTMRVTAQSILYSSATFIPALVPCVGWMIVIWWIVVAILMLTVGQRVSGLRATFAVLTLPILVFGSWIALNVGAVLLAASAGTAPAAFAPAHRSLDNAFVAIGTRAQDRGTGWTHAEHGLQLLTEGYMGPWDFVAEDTSTVPAEVIVGSGTLDDYENATRPELDALGASLPALPTNVVAHRVGDFVFTYHGIDAANTPLGLWIVIEHEMTDAGLGSQHAYAISVDGTIDTLSPWARPQLLQDQNTLRASHGLAPLPDPAMVLPGQFATADPPAPIAPDNPRDDQPVPVTDDADASP